LLLTSYGATNIWNAHGRDEGIAAFEASRSEVQRTPARSLETPGRSAEEIDLSLWAPERVERYRQSLHDAAVPEALLRIPSVKLVVPVFDGTSDRNLNRGASRIEGTARIGEPGNVGIAAHRDGFFRVLKDVRVGDVLLLDRLTASDAYRIVATSIVDPADVSVLQPTATQSVTLVTCFPFYYVGSAPRRFIVRAERVYR
jgi:sortase A